MALNGSLASQLPSAGTLGRALRPVAGEVLCGDQFGCWTADGRLRLALADGLGHGREAHAAAVAAMAQVSGSVGMPLTEVFVRCDQALRSTRGVALSVVEMGAGAGDILHAAVGNIRTLVIQGGRLRRLGGARGIVGAGFVGLHAEYLPIVPGDWLVMFSDGIRENAAIAEGLEGEDASDEVAQRLIERWARDDDDASLLIYRHG